MSNDTLQDRHIGGTYQIELWAADEFTTAETWIGAALTDLAGNVGGVHQWPAPEGTATPFVAFRFVTALPDVYNAGPTAPAMATLHYKVWAVDQAENYETVAPLAALIRAALNVVQTSVTGGLINRAKRIVPQKEEQLFYD